MRIHLIIVALYALAGAPPAALAASPGQPQGPDPAEPVPVKSISFIVRDTADKPVRQGMVKILSDSGVSKSAPVNNGIAKFSSLPAGRATVWVTANGFNPSRKSVVLEAASIEFPIIMESRPEPDH